jgi:hypothetical protein
MSLVGGDPGVPMSHKYNPSPLLLNLQATRGIEPSHLKFAEEKERETE